MISLTKDDFTKIIRNLDLNKTHDHDMIINHIRISSRELIYWNHVLRVANFHQIEKSKRCPTTVDMVKTLCMSFLTNRQLTCNLRWWGTRILGNLKIGWRLNLVPSALSKNKSLLKAVKNCRQADIKVFCSCSVSLIYLLHYIYFISNFGSKTNSEELIKSYRFRCCLFVERYSNN